MGKRSTLKKFYLALYRLRGMALLILFLAASGTYWLYHHTRDNLIRTWSEKLLQVTDSRQEEIVTYFREQEKKVSQFASEEKLVQRAGLLQGKFAQLKTVQDYKKIIREEKSFFEQYQKILGSKNITLISPQGDILFDGEEGLVGFNLNKPTYADSILAQSYARVIMGMAVDISNKGFVPLMKRQAQFISAPVIKEKKLIAVVSAELNDQRLVEMVNNYKDLGKTGEIVLGKLIDESIELVVGTRHSKSRIIPFSQQPFALQNAVLGERGIGIQPDYRHINNVSVWRYLPAQAWGIVGKMQVDEIVRGASTARILFYTSFILFMSFLLMVIIDFLRSKKFFLRVFKSISTPYSLALFGLLISSGIVTALVLEYMYTWWSVEHAVRQEAHEKVERTRRQMVATFKAVEFVAKNIANDLDAGRLKKEDLAIRVKRDLREYPNFFGISIAYQPFAYAPSQKLYAPLFVNSKEGIEEHSIPTMYDYTRPEKPGESITRWYENPVKTGAAWVEPFVEPLSKTLVAAYSVPFFGDAQKTKVAGVVTILYAIDKIKAMAEELGIGKTGYSFIISKEGVFLYHPVHDYVAKQKTIFEIADTLNNATLRTVGEKALRGEDGFARYLNEITAQSSAVYYISIPGTQWTLGITYIDDELPVTTLAWQRKKIVILFFVIITLLLLAFLLTKAYTGSIVSLWYYSAACSLLFILGIATVWYWVREKVTLDTIHGFAIADIVGLNKFLEDADRASLAAHQEPPLPIPTGIQIHSLSFPTPMQVELTADIWQKYDTRRKDIEKGVSFPQAVKITMVESYQRTIGDTEVLGWTVQATLAQNFNYARYPLDIKIIEILLRHKDKTKNIILIPDFEEYKSLNPVAKPGLGSLRVTGFGVDRTSFSFSAEDSQTTFGIGQEQEAKYYLNFNVLLERNLIDALVVFLLPLLVILVALFAITWLTLEPPLTTAFRPLSGYTAVMFALVILHRALREKLPSGEIIYLEYFFFFTYITMVILILNMIVQYSNVIFQKTAKKISAWIRILYWPVEFCAWFITTFIVFYN